MLNKGNEGGRGEGANGGHTKESEMMVLRPAVILGSERGTLLVLWWSGCCFSCASPLGYLPPADFRVACRLISGPFRC